MGLGPQGHRYACLLVENHSEEKKVLSYVASCSFELPLSGVFPPDIPFLMRCNFVQEPDNTAFSVVTFVLCVFSTILDTIVLWKQIIQRNGGVITNALNISCLAKVTDGFTQGHIVEAVTGVLTDRRIRQQTYKPLLAVEFIAKLTSMSPVYQEEEESFKVNGTPVRPGSSRRRLSHDLLPLVPEFHEFVIHSEIWKLEIFRSQIHSSLASKACAFQNLGKIVVCDLIN